MDAERNYATTSNVTLRENSVVQTIRQIRVIQRLCQASLSIAALTIGIFVTAILGLHSLSTMSGHILEGVFLGGAVMGGVLLLVIGGYAALFVITSLLAKESLRYLLPYAVIVVVVQAIEVNVLSSENMPNTDAWHIFVM